MIRLDNVWLILELNGRFVVDDDPLYAVEGEKRPLIYQLTQNGFDDPMMYGNFVCFYYGGLKGRPSQSTLDEMFRKRETERLSASEKGNA